MIEIDRSQYQIYRILVNERIDFYFREDFVKLLKTPISSSQGYLAICTQPVKLKQS